MSSLNPSSNGNKKKWYSITSTTSSSILQKVGVIIAVGSLSYSLYRLYDAFYNADTNSNKNDLSNSKRNTDKNIRKSNHNSKDLHGNNSHSSSGNRGRPSYSEKKDSNEKRTETKNDHDHKETTTSKSSSNDQDSFFQIEQFLDDKALFSSSLNSSWSKRIYFSKMKFKITFLLNNLIVWNPSQDISSPNFAFLENMQDYLFKLLSSPNYDVYLITLVSSDAEEAQVIRMFEEYNLFSSSSSQTQHNHDDTTRKYIYTNSTSTLNNNKQHVNSLNHDTRYFQDPINSSSHPDYKLKSNNNDNDNNNKKSISSTNASFKALFPRHKLLFCETNSGKRSIIRHIEPEIHVETDIYPHYQKKEEQVNNLMELAKFIPKVVCIQKSWISSSSITNVTNDTTEDTGPTPKQTPCYPPNNQEHLSNGPISSLSNTYTKTPAGLIRTSSSIFKLNRIASQTGSLSSSFHSHTSTNTTTDTVTKDDLKPAEQDKSSLVFMKEEWLKLKRIENIYLFSTLQKTGLF